MEYDVVIIGAGPAGLYAGTLSGMRGLKAVLIDESNVYGGQLNTYLIKNIYDLPGHLFIKAEDLKKQLFEQTIKYNIDIKLCTTISNIEILDKGFIITLNDNSVLKSNTILFTSGSGKYSPRKLDIRGAERAKNIKYFVNDLTPYANKNVVILGGGDSAIDHAIMISKVAKSTSIIHRRKEFRAKEESINKFREIGGVFYNPFEVIDVEIVDNHAISISITGNNDTIKVSCDEILVFYGSKTDAGILTKFYDGLSGINTNNGMESKNKGIYAAGKCAKYPGKIDNLSVSFGEVSTAIAAISSYLYPDKTAPFFSSLIVKEEKK